MKGSSDTIGNRTRDLPICSAVPQPTTNTHTNIYMYMYVCVCVYIYTYEGKCKVIPLQARYVPEGG